MKEKSRLRILFALIPMLSAGCVTPVHHLPSNQPLPAEGPYLISSGDLATQSQLDRHLPSLRYDACPIQSVFDDLQLKSGCRIVVDWDELRRIGVEKNSIVTARLRDIKLSKVLKLIFLCVELEGDDHKLAFFVTRGAVVITSCVALKKQTPTEVYDITHLVEGYSDDRSYLKKGLFESRSSFGTFRDERIEDIQYQIISAVDPDSWKRNGGYFGDIKVSKNNLMISQTSINHSKIRAFLKSMELETYSPTQPATMPIGQP